MKKLLFIVLSVLSISAYAQSEIVAGKNQDVEVSTSMNYAVGTEIRALRVIEADNQELIGMPIVCRVMESRKSNINGQEGRMVLRPLYILLYGNKVELQHDDIYLRGKNRSNVKFWLSVPIFPLIFVPGSGAKIKKDDTFKLTIK